jgi:DNA modification methylase
MNVINQEITDKFALYHADCVDTARAIPDNSIDFSVYSPPFESLYVFSNSERDMGNNASSEDFWAHYNFLIAEHFRIMKPGRLIAIHCMNLPTSKVRDGYIGIKDFRGEIIRAHQKAGFIYHSEVCIWKDPVVAMQRTKALGLLYKQLKKDSAMSRQGIADYLVVVRKPGDNPDPVTKTEDGFRVDKWQQYASPVWMDVNQTRTLQYMSARESDDERHISPLQLDVIERAIDLWTNPDDLVYSPFVGIGSELYTALKMGRRGVGSELKRSYFEVARRNLLEAKAEQVDLFSELGA